MPLICNQPKYLPNKQPCQKSTLDSQSLPEASEWLDTLSESHPEHTASSKSFASFYSSRTTSSRRKDTAALLPLLKEPINSPAMVAHCFKIISKIVNELNPGQPPVITADQPVYATAKQVQWSKPEEYGNIVVMMGL